jgi:RNA polymerase sigma-70 factor (ECF subfamily)
MDSTSASLLERLRRPDDHDAWQRFVALYTPLLYFWACRMGARGHDAADLVQEVFTAVLVAMPTFHPDPTRSFRSWLRTVALNKWRDHQRRQAVVGRAGNDVGLDEAEVPDNVAALWESEFQQHLAGRALDLMQSDFEPKTWRACWAQVVEGKPAEQVAQELGLSLASVYAARSRVLRRLRQELNGLFD